MDLKNKLYSILQGDSETKASKWVNGFLILLIILNAIAVIFETVEEVKLQYLALFNGFEAFSVLVFSVEYILRFWVITNSPKYKTPILGRLKYLLSPLALVDLISILPFYLSAFIPLDLRIIRIVRLIRLSRMFKLGRYFDSFKLLINVFKNKKEELTIAVLFMLIVLVIASTLMYFAENQAQPKVFNNILSSIWWGVVTLTTVGYGDVYPITPIGKFLASIIAVIGIGLIGLPTAIISSGLVEIVNSKKSKKTCPHCGKELE